MASGTGKNNVSVGAWMWVIFVMALPCIGFVMMFVWAFTGKNETCRNYFRARIAWFVIGVALMTAISIAGITPAIQKRVDGWIKSYAAERTKAQDRPAARSDRNAEQSTGE